jgi:hypothetical protein
MPGNAAIRSPLCRATFLYDDPMGDNEIPVINISIRYTGKSRTTGESEDKHLDTTLTGMTADKMMSLQAALSSVQDGGDTVALADSIADSIAYFVAPMMPAEDRRTMFRHLLTGNMLVEDVFNSFGEAGPNIQPAASNRATRRAGGRRGHGQRNRQS